MRNLKRALSLTLASVMLLGMMVVGAGAASFPDVDEDTHNIEAIEVLKAVNVMIGDDNGNFGPDDPVNRAQMAVVMANLLNLDYNYYEGQSTFKDVPSWAVPYVAACYANGIVSGYNSYTYGSGDGVTAVQAASMMMRALGYFKYTEDYKDGFELVTVRQGTEIGIFDGIDAKSDAGLTRNQVARMALNALESEMVSFTGTPGTTYTASNGETLSIGYVAKYEPRTSTELKYTAIEQRTSDVSGGNNLNRGQYYIQLGEELYNGKLVKKYARDDFERPSINWQYNGKEIGTYVDYDLLVAGGTYTDEVKGSVLYDLLTYTTIRDNDLLTYTDGVATDVKKEDLVRSNKNKVAGTGKGVLTEVFFDQEHDEIIITSINTYLAKANSDYNKNNESLSLKVYTGTGSGKVASTTQVVDSAVVPNAADVKKDDFVLVYMSGKENANSLDNYPNYSVVKLFDVEVMSDSSVTKFSTSTSKVVDKLTTGGTEYKTNVKAFYDFGNALETYDAQLLTNMTYNIFMDRYNNVIGVELEEGTKNYVFITGYDRVDSHISTKTAQAAAIFMDGTMDEITVNVTETNKKIKSVMDKNANYVEWGSNRTNDAEDAKNGVRDLNRWYTYTVNNNGTYTLKPVDHFMYSSAKETGINTAANKDLGIIDAATTKTLNSANLYLDDSRPTNANGLTYANEGRAYGNDDTVYITVEPGTVDWSANGGHTKDAITDVKGVYKGIQNVKIELKPEYKQAVNNRKYDGKGSASYDESETNAYVYSVFDNNYYIVASVVLGEAQGAAASYAYILGDVKSERVEFEGSSKSSGDATYYWEFDAFYNGEKVTLTAKTKYPGEEVLSPYHVQELRFDGDYVTSVKDVASNKVMSVNNNYDETNNTFLPKDEAKIDGQAVYDVGHVTAFEAQKVGGDFQTHTQNERHDSDEYSYSDHRLSGDIELVGRTLYTERVKWVNNTKVDNYDAGLALRSENTPTLLVQYENGKLETTVCSGVSEAIGRLADADNDGTNGKQFKGRIVAGLKDNTADWVVIISDTNLVTGNKPNYDSTRYLYLYDDLGNSNLEHPTTVTASNSKGDDRVIKGSIYRDETNNRVCTRYAIPAGYVTVVIQDQDIDFGSEFDGGTYWIVPGSIDKVVNLRNNTLTIPVMNQNVSISSESSIYDDNKAIVEITGVKNIVTVSPSSNWKIGDVITITNSDPANYSYTVTGATGANGKYTIEAKNVTINVTKKGGDVNVTADEDTIADVQTVKNADGSITIKAVPATGFNFAEISVEGLVVNAPNPEANEELVNEYTIPAESVVDGLKVTIKGIKDLKFMPFLGWTHTLTVSGTEISGVQYSPKTTASLGRAITGSDLGTGEEQNLIDWEKGSYYEIYNNETNKVTPVIVKETTIEGVTFKHVTFLPEREASPEEQADKPVLTKPVPTGVTNGEILVDGEKVAGTKINLGQPVAAGVKLPTQVTVDDAVTVTITWTCVDKETGKEVEIGEDMIALDPEKYEYTANKTYTPAEGKTEADFADEFIMTKDDGTLVSVPKKYLTNEDGITVDKDGSLSSGETDIPETDIKEGNDVVVPDQPVKKFNVTVDVDNADRVTVTGAGEYAEGAKAEIKVEAKDGFVIATVNGEPVEEAMQKVWTAVIESVTANVTYTITTAEEEETEQPSAGKVFLTVNYAEAPSKTVITAKLDGTKAVTVKNGEKVEAVANKDIEIGITVPRGWKVDTVTGAEFNAETGACTLKATEANAVVNITFAQRASYTLTLSGDMLVNSEGSVESAVAKGANDEGVQFTKLKPSGLEPNANGKYARTFTVYEGEVVTVKGQTNAVSTAGTVIVDGVAVELVNANNANSLKFTMPGKDYSLYMKDANKPLANANDDSDVNTMIAVYVDTALTVTPKDSNVKMESINGVTYVPQGTVLVVTGGNWSTFAKDAVSTSVEMKKSGAELPISTEVYIKPAVKVSADENVKVCKADGTIISDTVFVKDTAVQLNLLKGKGVLTWTLPEDKTVADAPIVGETTLVKPTSGRIAYTLTGDVALTAAAPVNVGAGVKAYADTSATGRNKVAVADGQYVAYGKYVIAEVANATTAGTAVVGLSGSAAIAKTAYETAPINNELTLVVAPQVTFNYLKAAYWGTESAQDIAIFPEDKDDTVDYTKVVKSWYIKPGTYVKVTAAGTTDLPAVTGDETVEAVEVTGSTGTVKFQVGEKALNVENVSVEQALISVGRSWYIYDKASWIAAFNDGVIGLQGTKGETNAEKAWEGLEAHGKATFPWLYVEILNPTLADVTFQTTVKLNGTELQDQKKTQTYGVTPTNWGITSPKSGSAFVHWELVKNSDTGVHSLSSESVKAAMGKYTVDVQVMKDGSATHVLSNQACGAFTQDMVNAMYGIAGMPTDAEFIANVAEEPGQAATDGGAEKTPLDVSGQDFYFEDGKLYINKAFDLTKTKEQGGYSDCYFGEHPMKHTDSTGNLGWFWEEDEQYAIVIKMESPIGVSGDEPSAAVKFKASRPSNGAIGTTDEDGVTYFVFALSDVRAKDKVIEISWGDDQDNLGHVVEVQVIDNRTGVKESQESEG